MDDGTRVLVGYATAAGSTAGIAERIAATLRETGADVTCRPVGPDLDPAAFDVLVVGSAVHNMAWLRPALDFLGRIPADGNRPTWCFSVGGVAPHGPADPAHDLARGPQGRAGLPARLPAPRATASSAASSR